MAVYPLWPNNYKAVLFVLQFGILDLVGYLISAPCPLTFDEGGAGFLYFVTLQEEGINSSLLPDMFLQSFVHVAGGRAPLRVLFLSASSSEVEDSRFHPCGLIGVFH